MSAPLRGEGTYLGDGVTASFDGFQIRLTTDPDTIIYLEPSVYGNLVRFAAKADVFGDGR